MKLIYQLGKKNQRADILSWRKQDAPLDNNIKILKRELQLLKPSHPEIKKKEKKRRKKNWNKL